MDDFARLPGHERRVYFEQTAARLGLSAQMIEKDFWVCWTLKRLFSLNEFQGHLTFKGGTTLSKVYRVIERFSEDLDISIDRAFLGFGGTMEPECGISGKEQQRRIEGLRSACQATIVERLLPQLQEEIAAQIGASESWTLKTDSTDKDGQTLLFEFPPAIGAPLTPYFAASVRIELGARSDHFPVEEATVIPYLSEAFTDALSSPAAGVRVLVAERTFWEKATILHSLHYFPPDKKLPSRMSRHYYDVSRLAQSPILQRAIAATTLLDRVAIHKSVFFKAAWAHYDSARLGTLCLMPCDEIVDDLKKDYLAMEPMFFKTPPAFSNILSVLSDLENQINHGPR